MNQSSIDMLESQKEQAERLIRNGYASSLFVQGIRHVGILEFGLNYPERGSYSGRHAEEVIELVTEVYQHYDKWKKENK